MTPLWTTTTTVQSVRFWAICVIAPRILQLKSSQYSVLAAVGNLPLANMVWFDGIGFQHAGGRGLLSIDAAGNAPVLLASTLLMLYRSLGGSKNEVSAKPS